MEGFRIFTGALVGSILLYFQRQSSKQASSDSASEQEEKRKIFKPHFSKQDVIRYAHEFYGVKLVEDEIKALDSYDDQNYYVKTFAGREFTFKFCNGADSEREEVFDAQNEFALKIINAGLLTAAPEPNLDGEYNSRVMTDVKLPNGEVTSKMFLIRMLRWVPGKDASQAEPHIRLIQSAGRFLAKSHKAIEGFRHKGAIRTHAWDLGNLLLLRDYLHVLPEGSKRDLVTGVLDEFEKDVLPTYSNCPRGVYQNDFNDSNMIVNEEETEVVGIIDFGDMMETCRINDLAIAMAYASVSPYGKRSDETRLETIVEFYKAYSEVTPLTANEKNILWSLVAARWCQSCTWGAYSFSKQPDNIYLLKHAQPAWDSLALIRSMSRKELDALL